MFALSILLVFIGTSQSELSETADHEGCQANAHAKGLCMRDDFSVLQKEIRLNTFSSKDTITDLRTRARRAREAMQESIPGAIVMVGARENIEASVLADACTRIMPLLKAHGVNRANLRFVTDQPCPEHSQMAGSRSLGRRAHVPARSEMSKWLEPDVDYSSPSGASIAVNVSHLTGKQVLGSDAQSIPELVERIAKRTLTGQAAVFNMPQEVTNLFMYFSGHADPRGVVFGKRRDVIMGPETWHGILTASVFGQYLFMVDSCYSGVSTFEDFLPEVINDWEVVSPTHPIAENIKVVAITAQQRIDDCKFVRADSCDGTDGGHLTMGLMQVLPRLGKSVNHTVDDLLNISWLNASSCLQESIRQGHLRADWKPTFYGQLSSLPKLTLSSFGLADANA